MQNSTSEPNLSLGDLIYSTSDLIYNVREKLDLINEKLEGKDVSTRPAIAAQGIIELASFNKQELIGIITVIEEIYKKLF